MSRLIWWTTALCVLSVATGCGYRFSGEGSGPRPGLHRIAIPVFENNTSEPDLGALFAGALRGEFLARGRMEVVPVEHAEAVFRGRITSINATAVAHRNADDTIQARLYITLDIRCEDARTGQVLWQDPGFTYYKVFIQNPVPMVTFDNRRGALDYLAREMAVRIHDRFLTSF